MLSDTQALKEIKGFNKITLYFEDFDYHFESRPWGKLYMHRMCVLLMRWGQNGD